MARYSQKIDERKVEEMVDAAVRQYHAWRKGSGVATEIDREFLERCVSDVVRARFEDHPLFFSYRSLMMDRTLQKFKNEAATRESHHERVVRNKLVAADDPALRRMIADAARHARRMGYDEMERRDRGSDDEDTGPSEEFMASVRAR